MPGVARLPASGLPAGVRFVEHTADVGIEAVGETVEECFARAAAGMFACFLSDGGDEGQPLDVEVRAGDVREVLVAWLEELLYLAEVGGLVPHTFEVMEVGASSLRGRVRARPLQPGDEPTGAVVKAVTRHELSVERADSGWRARALLDI